MARGPKKPGKVAARLLTEAGYLDALAEIYERLSAGGLTRDETSALIGARQCLKGFAEARISQEERAEHSELVEELRATREAMKNQGSGATRQTGKAISLPRRAGEERTTN